MIKKVWLIGLLLLCAVPAQASAQSDELIFQLKTLEAMTSEVRGLEIREDVEAQFHSREDMLAEFAYIPYDFGTYDPIRAFYMTFDLITDPTLNINALVSEMNGHSVGGYYDLFEKNINVVLETGDTPGDTLTPFEQIVYVHEFTHALQDQHFELQELMWDYGDTTEGFNALLALIEGDAMYMQEQFTQQASKANSALLDVRLVGENRVPDDSIPAIIRAELYLPYLDGMAFVKALYDAGGWEQVNAAYDNPPTSTEHILHPERYLADDKPIHVLVNNVFNAFEHDDWERITRDTFGEFYLRQFLSTQLDARSVDRAATGWGGDEYIAYHNETKDKQAFVMRIAWDSQRDSVEFADAFATFAALRTVDNGTTHEDITCWVDSEDAFCLQMLEGDSLIARAPTMTVARAMIAAQS